MPTIQYIQGQPFLIPDEVTELPFGAQQALPVQYDPYSNISNIQNQNIEPPTYHGTEPQAVSLPTQPDMWAQAARAGKRLLGVGGEERYQTWPERTIRSAISLPVEVMKGEVQSGPGLRREDVTDIPGTAQPLDPMMERAQDVAGLAGGTMFAGVKPGVASLGAGPIKSKIGKDVSYRGEHTSPIPDGGSPLYDVTTNAYPKDFYGPDGLRYYAPGNKAEMDASTYHKIVSMKDKPDELVKIYRAIPWEGKKPGYTLSGNNERSKINPGDWVTISKEYAKEHGEDALNGEYAITMKKVPAKELFTQGDSFHEWGWHPTLLSETSKVGAPLAALEKAPMFYSNVENAVKASKQNIASKEQWLSYLKNQPGVKSEELEWTVGSLPEGKITKQQLEQHIAENKVQFNEVWKGGNPQGWHVTPPDQTVSGKWMVKSSDYNSKGMLFNTEAEARAALAEKTQYPEHGQSKFNRPDLVLPGGENYRELLLTLPSNADRRTPLQTARELFENPELKTIYDLDNNQMRLLQKEIDNQVEQGEQLFRSSHWDEPNVLAHIRMNDRDIPDVGKSLHIEEIQSDWHQAGRKQGYKISEAEKNRMTRELEDIRAERNRLDDDPNQVNKYGLKYDELANKEADLMEKYNKFVNDAVPNAPFKKTWDELAIKRTIKEAVDNGYDAISWTPGEAQAARYDLSKQVDYVHYDPKSGDLWAGKGMNRVLNEENVKPNELEKYIGKEAADRIINNPTEKEKGIHILSGEKLKVGGEGMKAFYDKMMVDKVNSLAKKFGGKVESKDLDNNITKYKNGYRIEGPNDSFRFFETKDEAKNFAKQSVHVLKLTPELKKAVSEKGFPLFTGGLEFPKPLEQPTFEERWRERVPEDEFKQPRFRPIPPDYIPPERRFEKRPVRLTKVDYIPEF